MLLSALHPLRTFAANVRFRPKSEILQSSASGQLQPFGSAHTSVVLRLSRRPKAEAQPRYVTENDLLLLQPCTFGKYYQPVSRTGREESPCGGLQIGRCHTFQQANLSLYPARDARITAESVEGI